LGRFRVVDRVIIIIIIKATSHNKATSKQQ